MADSELKFTIRISRTGKFLAVLYALLFRGCRHVGVNTDRFSKRIIEGLAERHTQILVDQQWRSLRLWYREERLEQERSEQA